MSVYTFVLGKNTHVQMHHTHVDKFAYLHIYLCAVIPYTYLQKYPYTNILYENTYSNSYTYTYITLLYATLHYITLHYIALHYIACHYMT